MRVNISLGQEELAELDAYAAENGVSRSAAITHAVRAARDAPTMADLRLMVAQGVNQVTQKRMGVQEVTEVDGELVKAADPETEANREAFLERRRAGAAARRAAEWVDGPPKPPALAQGERVVEAVDPLDF